MKNVSKKGVTVIVPVYNTEDYLCVCLDSIIQQTFSDLEIILVDDGSEDTSGKICDAYARKDTRIKVIHKENAGLVAARKTGIENSTMPYITFVDSDDWIDVTLIQSLFDNISEIADMVTSGICFEWADGKTEVFDCFRKGIYTRDKIDEEIIPEMMFSYSQKGQGILQSVCGKIFKKSSLQEVKKILDDNVTIGEDGTIVYPYVLSCRGIVITKICGYHYRQRDDSMVHNKDYMVFQKIKLLQEHYCKVLQRDNMLLRNQINHSIKRYIRQFSRRIYELDFDTMEYCSDLPRWIIKGKRVVIYGAGKKGNAYYEKIMQEKIWKIVLWVDKNYSTIKNMYVESPEKIKTVDYDYIIIAIESETVNKEIINYLKSMGVSEKKIVARVV